MADHDHGGARRRQFALQPADRLDIEMVRRFVQQHEIRIARHQRRQCRAPPLTTAGGPDRPGRIELQPFARPLDTVHLSRGQPMRREIAQRREPAHIGVLLHISHTLPRRQDHIATVRFNQPGHDLHQGGFARPVAPDQRNALALLHNKIEIVENRLPPEGEGDAIQLKKGCTRHGAQLNRRPRPVNRAPRPCFFLVSNTPTRPPP